MKHYSIALFAAGFSMLASFSQAATVTTPVTVNLGTSAQIFTLAGLGGGFFDVSIGACTFASGSTSCSLSGNYTGSTSGFTGGTYSLITTYSGNNPN